MRGKYRRFFPFFICLLLYQIEFLSSSNLSMEEFYNGLPEPNNIIASMISGEAIPITRIASRNIHNERINISIKITLTNFDFYYVSISGIFHGKDFDDRYYRVGKDNYDLCRHLNSDEIEDISSFIKDNICIEECPLKIDFNSKFPFLDIDLRKKIFSQHYSSFCPSINDEDIICKNHKASPKNKKAYKMYGVNIKNAKISVNRMREKTVARLYELINHFDNPYCVGIYFSGNCMFSDILFLKTREEIFWERDPENNSEYVLIRPEDTSFSRCRKAEISQLYSFLDDTPVYKELSCHLIHEVN